MLIIYSKPREKFVTRQIGPSENIPALIRTSHDNLGCWSCGAAVIPTGRNSMACVECNAEIHVCDGRAVRIEVSPEGSAIAKAVLTGPEPNAYPLNDQGDFAVFPAEGDPDFDLNEHDPIGCSPLDLLWLRAKFLASKGDGE